MAGAGGRRGLRTETVECPAWSDKPFQMREPSIRDYRATAKVESDQDKAIILLGAMVLDDDGKSVGEEAILDAPLSALSALSLLIPRFTGEGAAPDAPLAQTSGSDTA